MAEGRAVHWQQRAAHAYMGQTLAREAWHPDDEPRMLIYWQQEQAEASRVARAYMGVFDDEPGA